MARNDVFLRFPCPAPQLAEGESALPFFGGDQEWFAGYTARLSGCGPVAAANAFATLAAADARLAAVLNIHPGPDGSVGLEVYKDFMERVFGVARTRQIRFLCDYVDKRHARAAALLASGDAQEHEKGRAILQSPLSHIPATFGNSAASLRRGVDRFATGQGLSLLWRQRRTRRLSYEAGLSFIASAFDAGASVILLNHLNRVDLYYHGKAFTTRPVKGENPTMHFVTIVGTRRDENDEVELILSDAGQLVTTSYRDLHTSWQTAGTLGGSLLWFSIAQPVFEPLAVPAAGEAVGAV